MKIRSYSWGAATLSWSIVMEELLHAMEEVGHDTYFISTNGDDGMRYFGGSRAKKALEFERELIASKQSYDIDITYTVPQNFPERFLANSKAKMAVYCYESSHMPKKWKNFYHLIDYVLPASTFVRDMFIRNGCPEEKIRVIPHGVDLKQINTSIKPIKIKTEKKFKFLCVAEPHYRKQLDRLLHVYCNRFSSKDDVCLVIKTKIFKDGDSIKPFEMDIRPTWIALNKKYGKAMPEVKFITERLDNLASLYNACDAFVSITASEGFCLPFLEALACELPVIAPRYGGQLDFLNDDNAFLCDTGIRLARAQEQYWEPHPEAVVGAPNEEHFGNLMVSLYSNFNTNKANKLAVMRETVKEFTWKQAAQKIIKLVQ